MKEWATTAGFPYCTVLYFTEQLEDNLRGCVCDGKRPNVPPIELPRGPWSEFFHLTPTITLNTAMWTAFRWNSFDSHGPRVLHTVLQYSSSTRLVLYVLTN